MGEMGILYMTQEIDLLCVIVMGSTFDSGISITSPAAAQKKSAIALLADDETYLWGFWISRNGFFEKVVFVGMEWEK